MLCVRFAHLGLCARRLKRHLSEISAEKKAQQKARGAFLEALKFAERLETVRKLGQTCNWRHVKDFNDIYGRSPLHLAVTMLDRRQATQAPFLLLPANST
jgi:hypothetical protein